MPNFPTPKESRHRKFQTQQVLWWSPSLKIGSTSTGVSFHLKFLYRTFCLWRTSYSQNKLSKTKLNRRDQQVKRKQPRMGKEPSIFYFLETEIHATGKRSTLNSSEKASNNLKWVSHFEVWPSPLGICVASRYSYPPWGIWNQMFVSGRGEYRRVLHF